jgi:hypothetical protein
MSSNQQSTNPTMADDELGNRLLKGLVKELLRRIETEEVAATMTAAEMTLIRQLCSDNSITLASIQRGDFGAIAQAVAEEYPFPDGPTFTRQ